MQYFSQKAVDVEEEETQATLANYESSESEGPDFDDDDVDDDVDKNSSRKKVYFSNVHAVPGSITSMFKVSRR